MVLLQDLSDVDRVARNVVFVQHLSIVEGLIVPRHCLLGFFYLFFF